MTATDRGIALVQAGRKDEALACFQEALRLDPGDAVAHNNLAFLLRGLGRVDESIAHCQEALRLQPGFSGAHNNLGVAFWSKGQFAEAAGCFRQAIWLQPNYTEAYNNLGASLKKMGQLDAALANFGQALRIDPQHADTLKNLGTTLGDLGRFDEAIHHLDQALRARPGFAEAYNNRGVVFWDLGRFEEALADFEQAVHFRPDYADGRSNRAFVLLLLGDYERGWPEYEWRWRRDDVLPLPMSHALWDGSPLGGRTILLFGEQGLGDTLQFVRYARLVKARGGRVAVLCQSALHHLLARTPGIDLLLSGGQPLPAFDVHAPLMSLPRIFGTTLATVPAEVPYVAVDEPRVKYWRGRLADYPGFKVGIVWHGSAKPVRLSRQRSIPLAKFAALAAVPGVRFFSLQKGPGREQIAPLAGSFPVIDLGEQLDETSAPFLDTAAVMKSLDLVIAADTAIGHLAGALAVPVWVAQPFAPDWRWLLKRSDSPWYPTMRLFRSERIGDWEPVFARIAAELRRLV